MKRIAAILGSLLIAGFIVACGGQESTPGSSINPQSSADEAALPQEQVPTQEIPLENTTQQIQIETELGNVISFVLNDSSAAKDLYNQLPLEIAVENYAHNEKIFYPPSKLGTKNTPLAKGPVGTLAYYEPWGNVVIYYGDCGGAGGLYELGKATQGTEHISTLNGTIHISAVTNALQQETSSQSILSEPTQEEKVNSIKITAENKAFTATLSNNSSADAFVKLLKKSPIDIKMRDNSGFEKVGSLGASLPESNTHITAQAGDIILYNGNQICAFYGSNSWSYTRLGKIDDLSGWQEALGGGDVTLTFSIP